MDKQKIKVVWIATFKNAELRNNLQIKIPFFLKLAMRLCGKKTLKGETDSAQWVTNGIKEFKNFKDIELHVITYATNLKGKIQNFVIDGIHYHIYNSSCFSFAGQLKKKFGLFDSKHKKDRATIKKIIAEINPDIVHIIGAENPEYSLSALDAPTDKPLVLSLQTLMLMPNFFENYPISKSIYDYRSTIERKVIDRADYICSRAKIYKKYILENIKQDAIMLNMGIALGVDPVIDPRIEKKYDFVYFANNISKAFDYALECFAIAKKTHPQITMNVIGGYSEAFIQQMMARITELGLNSSITFSGRLATHTDVMLNIQKSRFALLPLKVDLMSGTVREAMRHGLPTLSTITKETPLLNDIRESILLSEVGDYEKMAANMCRLLDDAEFAQKICENGKRTIEERYSNSAYMEQWRRGYYEILDNFHNNTPFSEYIQKQ